MIDWREKYKKQRLITIALIAMIIGSVIAVAGGHLLIDEEPKPQQSTGQVMQKIEIGSKHFLQIEIEVSPEEYIGYDIGDEYEVHK